jgi:cobalt-zinc-cadmium efflux system protein
VIAAAVIIRFTGWAWVDSVVAAGIGLWVLPRTWTLLKESTNVLLQGAPTGIDVLDVEARIRAVDGVAEVHDLHVWALTSGRNILSTHLVIDASQTTEREAMKRVIELVATRFGITESTVQVEVLGDNPHISTSEQDRDARHGEPDGHRHA